MGIKKTKGVADASLQVEYSQFAKTALANGQFHLLANKDDVVAVVRAPYDKVGLTFDEEGLFERLIGAATPTTWFVEWTELAAAVT